MWWSITFSQPHYLTLNSCNSHSTMWWICLNYVELGFKWQAMIKELDCWNQQLLSTMCMYKKVWCFIWAKLHSGNCLLWIGLTSQSAAKVFFFFFFSLHKPTFRFFFLPQSPTKCCQPSLLLCILAISFCKKYCLLFIKLTAGIFFGQPLVS